MGTYPKTKPAAILWRRWIQKVQTTLKSRKAFTYWMGYGAPPFLLGNIPISFSIHWTMGMFSILLMSCFTWHTLSTTCRRCPFYGTGHCVIGGKVVPFLPKLPDTGISIRRVWQQYCFDLAIMVYTICTYCFLPLLLPLVVLGSVGALMIVYIPKRHHGLFYRLKV
jgi:hypothetical protein